MRIEPFGFIVLLAGAAALFAGDGSLILLGFVFTVFAAAAAVSVPMLGGATITPPYLFSVFLILKGLAHENGAGSVIAALSLRNPGGWLALVACYGIFVSLVAPGLFPDILVYTFSRPDDGIFGMKLLQFGSSQITQGVYVIGALLLFVASATILRRPGASRNIVRAFAACTALNLLFACLDLLNFYSGTADLLSLVRSADYAQLSEQIHSGAKRIAGSFSEPAAFGIYSCLLLGFWSSLWMQRYRPRLSGPLAFATLVAMLFSTSSTAYVALPIMFLLLLVSDLSVLLLGGEPRRLVFAVIVLPIVLFLSLTIALMQPNVVDSAFNMLDETIFNKLNTASGIERSAWNSQSWQNFIDTYGMGIGIGGARASSYLFVLLGNVGVVGTVAYSVFIYKILSRIHLRPSTNEEYAVGIACRWAFAGSLISNLISAGVFELGVQTYLAAAAAAAVGCRYRVTNRGFARPIKSDAASAP